MAHSRMRYVCCARNHTCEIATYQFQAVATYDEGCRATGETHWSIHVEPEIDPGAFDVTLTDVVDQPDGRHGVLTMRVA